MSFVVKNNAESTVADNPLAQAATTLNVPAGEGVNFPSTFPFRLTLSDEATYPDPGDDPDMEVTTCTARTTDALTIIRGEEGTADVAHALGTRVAMLITAGIIDELIAEVVEDTTPQLGGDLDPNAHFIGMAKGGDIASASPLVIDTDGDYFGVTGTNNFAAMTVAANRHFILEFKAILTMTHHATNLDLPGEANITTSVGDVAEFFSTGANTVQCVSYTKADGTAVIGGAEDDTVVTKVAGDSPYTATSSDDTVLCNATAGAITINLPTAVGISGKKYNIKKTDSSANAATIDPNGAETIDLAATVVISGQHDSYTVQSDNANWRII